MMIQRNNIVFKFFLCLCLLSSVFCLAGCTTFDRTRVVLDVPFVSQQTNHCGIASLEMVLHYYNLPVDREHLADSIYIPALEGTIPGLIVDAAKKYGCDTQIVRGNLKILEDSLNNGIPPIVFFGPSESAGKGHFAVVTGIRRAGRIITLHSGTKPNQQYSTPDFMKQWKSGRFTAIIITKTGLSPLGLGSP